MDSLLSLLLLTIPDGIIFALMILFLSGETSFKKIDLIFIVTSIIASYMCRDLVTNTGASFIIGIFVLSFLLKLTHNYIEYWKCLVATLFSFVFISMVELFIGGSILVTFGISPEQLRSSLILWAVCSIPVRVVEISLLLFIRKRS